MAMSGSDDSSIWFLLIAMMISMISMVPPVRTAPIAASLTIAEIACEAGWIAIEGECVTTVYADFPTTFDKALTTCLKVNATLPLVHSEDEWQRRIRQINQSHIRSDAWLGLAYNPQTKKFRWMDYSNMSWSNFLVDPEPVDPLITNCVFTNSTYKWFVQECSKEAPFVCIKPGFPLTTHPTSSRWTTAVEVTTVPLSMDEGASADPATIKPTNSIPKCSDGGSSSGVGCILGSSTTGMTWDGAKSSCKDSGRSLVYTKTREEWIRFQASRTTLPNMENIWIGIRFDQKSRRMELTDGSPWNPSSGDWFPWAAGQPPSDDSDEDRCAASTKKLNYLWSFESCDQSSFNGICYGSNSEGGSSSRGTVAFSTTGISSSPTFRTSFFPKVNDRSVAAASQGTTPTTKKPRNFIPMPMSEAARISSLVVQSMGCVFIIGGICMTLFLFLVFRNLSVEKIIIANQDLALLIAHCFVLTLREPALYPTMSGQLCKTVAVLLHYFFTCSYVFMLLEALQMMYIIGHINKAGAFLPTYVMLAIGWGSPLALVAITGPIIGDEYSTSWTCWGDLERRFGWALFFPMVCICACIVIIVESAGIMNRQDPPRDADPTQLFSAKISQRGIVVVMSLTVASHVLGIVAVYFQQVFLYVACFGLNVSCGTAIVFFHTAVDSKIRAFVLRMWSKVKGCCCKSRRRSSTN